MSRVTLAIVIVAVVVIVTVLGVVAYTMSLGFSDDGLRMTPVAVYDKMELESGWQITIWQLSRATDWSDIQVLLSDGANLVKWNINGADLDGGREVTAACGARVLGTLSVTLTVTDLSGNGTLNHYDHYTLSASPAFSSTTNYSTVLLFNPTGENMGLGATFTG